MVLDAFIGITSTPCSGLHRLDFMFTLDMCAPEKMVWSPAAVSHSVHSEGCVKQKTWQSVFLNSQNKSQDTI